MNKPNIDWIKTQADIIQKSWQDPKYLDELRADPKAVLADELGLELPDEMSVELCENTNDTFNIVLPVNSRTSEGELSEAALGEVAGGLGIKGAITLAIAAAPFGLVGVAVVGAGYAYDQYKQGAFDKK